MFAIMNGQETTIFDIFLVGYANFVDNGTDLELVGEPFVDRHRHLATLALYLVTAVAVFLVHADHDAWHFGLVDNRRDHHAKSANV